MTTTQTEQRWFPARAKAQRALNEARERYNRADARFQRLRGNRQRGEEQAANIRAHGLEPHIADGTEDEVWLAEQSARLVRQWESEADIAAAEKAAAAVLKGVTAAEQELAKVKADDPGVSLSELQAKAKKSGRYEFLVLHPITNLKGRDYDAGELIPKSISNQISFTKKNDWLIGRNPTIARI